jgi:hypothetical protein
MNEVETYDFSVKKPNITRDVFLLGDNYSMFVAPKTVQKGKSAQHYTFEALHINR